MTLLIPDFSKVRVLVVGDVMLDRYWYGKTSRISPEAPVPVVQLSHSEERPGGASNVALNTASLGCPTTLLGLVGEDRDALTLTELVHQKGITCHLEKIQNKRTITKSRIISHHQQLVRLDVEERFSKKEAACLLSFYEQALPKAMVVVLSDYAKGLQAIIPTLISIAQAHAIPVFVDPKSREMSLYRGATLVTPNFLEFETAVGCSPDEKTWVARGFKLLKDNDWQALLVTRGEEGMSLLQRDKSIVHFPADHKEVFDVTGAGDTVIAVLAAAFGGGVPLPEATLLANKAAGIVVSKLGAVGVSKEELELAVMPFGPTQKILSEEMLLQKVKVLKAQGKTIVMTNGCFDILHVGHVTYLEQAKQKGSFLIVAVNADHSVHRLKGTNRPIHPLSARLSVLAGLSCIDALVSFKEDTPERLIRRIKPHILVKGGDWKVEEVAGHDTVIKNGGQVEILPLVPEYSTSLVLQKVVQG
ncbi:MAG: bifunctional D-glycero-beta-D-manno-heptose-7-phosphate kinase/D-glycero-beta-D-manno-heptose 1-phosphate adenylyltransferase HldE [Gammaproteobacteria bacterium]|nr:bifunctional D-glycero-beta-D-manno-heptose-7-phosphate kinase/D-glycero-beta-D-manno-heptose 1-phosphate adenylyltransferase HldE [Gammaproteobacteria bacterium]